MVDDRAITYKGKLLKDCTRTELEEAIRVLKDAQDGCYTRERHRDDVLVRKYLQKREESIDS